MKNKIDFFTHHYFPYYMIILGIVLIPVVGIPVYPLLSIGVALLSVLLLSTHFRLAIEPVTKMYRVYLWIFGFRSGKNNYFQKLEYLYVNKLTREAEYGLVARLSFRKEIYAGFVKLQNGENLYIGESASEERILRKAATLAGKLNIEVRRNY